VLGNYYYSPLGLYGWLGLYAMSVMTTRVIWLVGNVCLVGNDQDPQHFLGFSTLVKSSQKSVWSTILDIYTSYRSLFTLYNNKIFVMHQQ
jgi:hypothetical protein